jgi:putative transposase
MAGRATGIESAMARQRHYRNSTAPGICLFATTTVLDFVPVFKQDRLARLAIHRFLQVHRRHGARLHAFVFMPEHLHFLTTLPDHLDSTRFAGDLKTKIAQGVLPHLDAPTKSKFAMQTGLNRRVFWQRSFRGFSVEGEEIFWQKATYIHLNPVRRKLVQYAEDYRWSSAKLFMAGKWNSENGLEFDVSDLDA